MIGNGWQGFKNLFAASSVLFGVMPNGDLRWHSYHGDGTSDPSGATGWHSNSSNVIGRGWDRFSRIVGGPDDHGKFGIALYAVQPNGDLFWYKYEGNGESNPTVSTWVAPGLRNPDWAGLLRQIGQSSRSSGNASWTTGEGSADFPCSRNCWNAITPPATRACRESQFP